MKQNDELSLIGNKVIMIPYRVEHVEKYHRWMEDEQLRELTNSEPLSLEEQYEMQRCWRTDDDKYTFVILSKDLLDQSRNEIDSMIGDVNVFLSTDDDDEKLVIGELNVMIAEPCFRRTGCGREAVILMMLFAIDQLKVRRFCAKIGLENSASRRFFESLGFMEVARSDFFNEVTYMCDPFQTSSAHSTEANMDGESSFVDAWRKTCTAVESSYSLFCNRFIATDTSA